MNDAIAAHTFSTSHKEKLLQDNICGCFYCLSIFSPKEIMVWLEDVGGTAICPHCGIDSVIGESAGFPITKAFLERMKKHWF